MKRVLLVQLVLPLVAATGAALLAHARWPADGFFMNLAAGFVGSLVTVGYIDWILQRHEQERWKAADARIRARLRHLATATITGIRTSFGFGSEIFDRAVMATGDVEVMQAEVTRVAMHVLMPAAIDRVAALDVSGWKRLILHLQEMSTYCGTLLDRFGQRLQPSTIATVLDLQQALESAQTFWRVFPDIAGVPVANLPKTKTSSERLQSAWCELSAQDVRKVLQLCAQLSREARGA